MAIIIIDNFQVDINNPIDNRFVVGSQSIPTSAPSLYPTPFYAYKEDIIYKYPGLRIWDFNVNVPYVWSGTQWINENTTSAVVENATTGNTGFQNFLAKFKDNTTLLTKGIVYDNGSNIGIGLTGISIEPGGVSGLHVSGNIKTNGGFVGIGSGITQINATNITSGSLDLKRITTPPFAPAPGGVYILKNNNGTETGTSWSPFLSNGLQITDEVSPGVNNIRIESKSGNNLGEVNPDGIAIYDGLDANKIHQFKRIKSSSLNIEPDGSNSIKIEVPSSFEGTDYYVNSGYDPGNTGLEQLGTRSKPFRFLSTCLNKILNRPTVGVTPATYKDTINGGQAWPKWHNRNGEKVRVVIQTYCEALENLAINGVTYTMEGSSSQIWITKDVNIEYLIDMKELTNTVTRNTDGSLPYQIETRIEGSGTIGFAGYYQGQADWHPYRKGFFRASGTNAFDYTTAAGGPVTSWSDEPDCYLYVGSEGGTLGLLMAQLPNLTYVPLTAEDGAPISREGVAQNGYNTSSEPTPDYGCIQVEGRNSQFWESLELRGTLIINAQEQHQIYQKDWGSSYSDNGRIYLRRNYQQVLYDSIEYKIQGNRTLYELDLGRYYRVISAGSTTLANWKAIAVSTSWREAIGGLSVSESSVQLSNIVGKVFQRNSDSVGDVGTGQVALCYKRYLPSKNVYDIYLKDGGNMNYGGDFYTQQNTAATQGGADAFVCLETSGEPTEQQIIGGDFRIEKSCNFAANGGGFVTNLLYNSYIKSIVHDDYNNYTGHGVSFKNLKLESQIYNYVTNMVTQTGAASTKITRDMSFKDSFLADYYGEIKLPFSNITNKYYLGIVGTTINQPGGYFNNRLPLFADDAPGRLAATSSLWPGMFYRVPDGNGCFTVKVVG